MRAAIPIEHHVFVIRAWRTTPDAPWEFVLHRSGTNEVLYADSEAGLMSALSQHLGGQHAEPQGISQRVTA